MFFCNWFLLCTKACLNLQSGYRINYKILYYYILTTIDLQLIEFQYLKYNEL